MSCSAKMRKLSVRIDADLKAAFEGTLRDIGVDPTCAMRSFAFQIVLEGSIPFDPVDAGFEASGKTAVTSAKIPEDVAGEMESVLKGLGTNFSQVVRLLALQTTALGGMPFAAGVPLVAEGAQLLELFLRVLLRRQLFAGGFPDGPGRLFSARRPAASGCRSGQGAGADVTQASLLPKRKQ